MEKINVLSPGRFHVLDLARELAKNGYDVKFYSFVPTKRVIKFGLHKDNNFSLFYLLLPFLFLAKKAFKKAKWSQELLILVQDYLTGILMRKCDVCIALSGNYIYSVKKAKEQGSTIIIERGSKHILEQAKILRAIKGIKTNGEEKPNFYIRRELESYKLADYIAVASQHVYDSFVIHNFDMQKLFVNPYGVDLSMFYPDDKVKKEYDVIMVGGWSYRKGCDLIVDAIKQSNYRFLHVGSIVDMEFPQGDKRFTHIDAVDQKLLVNYYNQAKVFVLPSREEGLAMVQAQAIACNLPLVGSKDSGAEDLKEIVEHSEFIIIIEDFTPAALLKAIDLSIIKQKQMNGIQYAGNAVERLTWKAYGDRYSEFINKIARK